MIASFFRTNYKELLYIRFLLLFFCLSQVACKSSASLSKARKQTTAAILKEARKYYGAPYRLGGTSIKGIDCSALVQNAFTKAGVNMPRTTSQQIKLGRKVELKKIQKGDLIFFKSKKNNRKATHVGIVTRVQSSKKAFFIHASTSRGVREDNLFSNYWSKLILFAKRIF